MIVELAEANRQLETMMAENTGLHAQLLTQAREAGVLEERQRMAREIHDTLAQGLAGIITQLEAAQQAGLQAAGGHGDGREASRADWERRISNATRLARDSLSEARRSVRAVRPEALENTKLPEALAEVAGRWSAVNGVRRHGHHHRDRAGAAPRGGGDPAARRAGGAGQRGQARGRVARRDHPVLHGRRGDAGRPRRRHRFPGRPAPGRTAAASG